MEETLYSKLMAAEKTNEEIREEFNEFEENLLAFYDGMPGFVMPTFPEIPKVDIPALQRDILQEYEGNYILGHTIKKITTVEQTLIDLAKPNNGFKRIFPRRKNDYTNELVEEMADLVSPVDHLRHNGLLSLDNFLNNYLLTSAVVAAITVPLAIHHEVSQITANCLANTIFATPLASAMSKRRRAELPFEQARYIDQKVHELY